jgi:hypothetical protein
METKFQELNVQTPEVTLYVHVQATLRQAMCLSQSMAGRAGALRAKASHGCDESHHGVDGFTFGGEKTVGECSREG